MAGEEYIRASVDNLRKLITMRQTEAAEIRRQMDQDETAKRQRLDAINNQIRMLNVQLTREQNSDMKQRTARQIADLEAEKSHLEHDAANIRQMHEQSLRDKENQWRNVERKANEIQSMM